MVKLGGGRRSIEDNIDHIVGVQFTVKHGDTIHKNDTIALVHAKHKQQDDCFELVRSAVSITGKKPKPLSIILDTLQGA
ncbi:MAG: hypothetical protein U5R06_08455 [candidate division KSB1 bacterium]|nr:hypothetical protein [candidate division KSB1 bacterium]